MKQRINELFNEICETEALFESLSDALEYSSYEDKPIGHLYYLKLIITQKISLVKNKCDHINMDLKKSQF